MIKDDGRNVGFIQLTCSDEGTEFGISIRDEERGKGYGTAGMKLAVAIARKHCQRCFARIRDDNYASQYALMKAGFKRTDQYEMREYPQAGLFAYRRYEL